MDDGSTEATEAGAVTGGMGTRGTGGVAMGGASEAEMAETQWWRWHEGQDRRGSQDGRGWHDGWDGRRVHDGVGTPGIRNSIGKLSSNVV